MKLPVLYGLFEKISERKDESGETLYLTMAIPNTEIKTIYKNPLPIGLSRE